MITSKEWFIFSAVAFLTAVDASGAPSSRLERPPVPQAALRAPAVSDGDSREPSGLVFRLLKETIEPGERATLEMILPISVLESAGWKEEEGPPAVNDDLLTQAKSLQILDTTYRRTSEGLVWGYDLTAHKAGRVLIPPVEIRVGTQTFSTEAAELRIRTTRPESDNQIREEFGALELPSRFWHWILWLSLVPIAYYLRRWIDRRLPFWIARFKRRAAEPLPPPPEDPALWLRREIDRLKAVLDQGAAPVFADDLTAVLREYFSRVHGTPARAWTTREFGARFTGVPTAQAMIGVFQSCDEVKFTGKALELPSRFSSALSESERVLLCGT